MEILKSYTMLCFFFLYFGFKVRTSMLSFALSLCVKTNKGEKEQKREKKKKRKEETKKRIDTTNSGEVPSPQRK